MNIVFSASALKSSLKDFLSNVITEKPWCYLLFLSQNKANLKPLFTKPCQDSTSKSNYYTSFSCSVNVRLEQWVLCTSTIGCSSYDYTPYEWQTIIIIILQKNKYIYEWKYVVQLPWISLFRISNTILLKMNCSEVSPICDGFCSRFYVNHICRLREDSQ